MTTIEAAAELLVRANLAGGAAIVLVAGLRRRARARFGAEVAYGLWLAPVAAALACLVPARTLRVPASVLETMDGGRDAVAALLGGGGLAPWLVGAWALGALAVAARLGLSQARFLRDARRGLAGPAVSGLVWPRLIVPDDYEARFTAEERRIIRAHERMHVDRRDLLSNAAIAAAQVACWFNPLVHWAARTARHDQELACDAAVMAKMPRMRKRYAQTLLKTLLAEAPPPLGCYWPAPGRHPLEERIGLLREGSPVTRRYLAGSLAVVALTLAVGGGTWAVKPVRLEAAPVVRVAAARPQPVMSFVLYRRGWPGV